jgi:hypothetical protein
MKLLYIPLGSFCHPKILIRETNRELLESLPFDFHSSQNLIGIVNILKELYETGNYELKFKNIINIHDNNSKKEKELIVSEENLFFVHFFKETDLINHNTHNLYNINNINHINNNNIDNNNIDINNNNNNIIIDRNIINFPLNINNIKEEKMNEVKNIFKKRFERLYNILNDTNNVLCFLRIENYENHNWKYEVKELTNILLKFKNPNKFLLYSQNQIDIDLHFNNSRVLNYEYSIPIFFFKYFFYDVEMILNKDFFITLLNTFEYIVNNKNNIIHLKKNGIVEKYFLQNDNKNDKIFKIFKLNNINNYSKCYYDEKLGEIFITTVFSIYFFKKNKDNIFEEFFINN